MQSDWQDYRDAHTILTRWLPIPLQSQYHSLGPTGQKMSRILLYIVHKYNRRELSREAYQVAHILMTEAWRRVNDDPEFCEETELELELDEL